MEIAKGAGSALEDIPNVAEKLGRLTRNSHMVGLLHNLLFGGKMKVRRPNRYNSSLTGLLWQPFILWTGLFMFRIIQNVQRKTRLAVGWR